MKSFTLILFLLALLPAWANAVNRCESVFFNQALHLQTRPILRESNNETLLLIEALQIDPRSFESSALQSRVNELIALEEKYFHLAGISFQKIPTTLEIKNLQDTNSFLLKYNLYLLQGDRSGDEASRLMWAVHVNPKNAYHIVRFQFDPLFLLREKGRSHGKYSTNTNTIYLGPQVFSLDAVGLSTTLRHEVTHYFEQIKMLKGEMTLARFVFANDLNHTEAAYGDHMRLDEIETHLRDLRVYRGMSRTKKDQRTSESLQSAERMQKVLKIRKDRMSFTLNLLQRMLKDSQQMMNQIEKANGELGASFISVSPENRDPLAIFVHLRPPYERVRIELVGLLKAQDFNDVQKVQKAVQDTIQWNRMRLDQISREVDTFTRP